MNHLLFAIITLGIAFGIEALYAGFLIWLGFRIQKRDHKRLKEEHDAWVKAMMKAGYTIW